ncbi:hypothetical protein RRG08_044941 [Elysia crispata]|uniref:Uncharacterized protein n=1 Tax=Elysia crispata TaxID=231223 RepID=A0AAE0ZTH2_9GAST|nr:hypothetical protein RRG08_044941 [Elysia crispata]
MPSVVGVYKYASSIRILQVNREVGIINPAFDMRIRKVSCSILVSWVGYRTKSLAGRCAVQWGTGQYGKALINTAQETSTPGQLIGLFLLLSNTFFLVVLADSFRSERLGSGPINFSGAMVGLVGIEREVAQQTPDRPASSDILMRSYTKSRSGSDSLAIVKD